MVYAHGYYEHKLTHVLNVLSDLNSRIIADQLVCRDMAMAYSYMNNVNLKSIMEKGWQMHKNIFVLFPVIS